MDHELKIVVEWPNGTKLPVLAHTHIPGSQLVQMLRFACQTNEEIILFHDEIPLNLEIPLEYQLVKDGDIIKVSIISHVNQNESELSKRILELTNEAGKISDLQYIQKELKQRKFIYSSQSASDDEPCKFDDHFSSSLVLNHAQFIFTDPLPSLWEKTDFLNI